MSLNGGGDQRMPGKLWIPDDAELREDSWMIGGSMVTDDIAHFVQSAWMVRDPARRLQISSLRA